MKTQGRVKNASAAERAWKAADAEVSAQVAALFARCPELSGFSVQAKVAADEPNRPEDEELFVTAIGIAPRLSKDQYADIFEQIATVLKSLLSERQEAASLLRGRTFARVVH
ncbi:MAG: hypothetical protein JO035_09925 [Betaproteobacteria bacterium]|nr:hypothetical protein [Betaproteobacteria bacterium]